MIRFILCLVLTLPSFILYNIGILGILGVAIWFTGGDSPGSMDNPFRSPKSIYYWWKNRLTSWGASLARFVEKETQ